MSLIQSKIYNDGSHYIAIPQENFPRGKGCKNRRKAIPSPEQISLKEKFESVYNKSKKLPYKQRDAFINKRLQETIPDETERKAFIAENKDRKKRNLSKRYSLLWRKVRLQQWNWFVTLTFDSAKHTAESFKAKLKDTLKKLVMRKGWKYIGAWEHGSETERLHFHGIFVIPDGQMVGEIEQVSDYSTKRKRRRTKLQNTYFHKRFGLNEFEEISPRDVDHSVKYLIKYLDKDGNRMCQGGDVKPYFRSTVMDKDIVCPYGEEEKKYILADNFTCIDENGIIHGTVSPAVIEQMPKCN